MTDDESLKYVTFDRIPVSSFLEVKSLGPDMKPIYYKNLLQVILRNETFYFDLDDDLDKISPKEIGYVYGIDQLIDQDRFVNTGINH